MSNSATVSTGKLEDSAALQLSGIIIIVFILLLFMLVLLLLFFHYYWNHHTTGHPASLDLLQQHKGLDPSILKSIKVIEFSEADDQLGLECSVCLSQLSQGEKARFLPKCNHGFHMQCIDTWFHSHSTCPLCRNLVSISPEDLEAAAAADTGVSPNMTPQNTISSTSSSSSSSSSGIINDGHLAIDITIIRAEEEDQKSPVTPTAALYRSLSRLLSRNS